jgi:hypothetical protein
VGEEPETVVAPAAFCPNCGAPVPPGSDFCARCFQPLPQNRARGTASSPAPTDPLLQFPLPRGPLGLVMVEGQGPGGFLWLGFGVVLVVVGIAFLVSASFVHLEGTAFDRTCMSSPLCVPASELSFAFALGGTAALICGILVLAHSLQRGIRRSSWLTLPP